MKVVIAPDKFKGSLSSQEVANAIEEGILQAMPNCSIQKLYVADGGDGTGVDDVSVGAVLKVHQLVAPAAQLLLHGLGLVLVHLAAQRVNGSSHGDSPCTFRVNSV